MFSEKPNLILDSHSTYLGSYQKEVGRTFREYYGDLSGITIEKDIAGDRLKIVQHPDLDVLDENPSFDGKNFFKLSEFLALPNAPHLTAEAKVKLLEGKVLMEHTAGGMGERLNEDLEKIYKAERLGYKFEFMPLELADRIGKYHEYKPLFTKTTAELSLGVRHMLAKSFMINNLSKEYDRPGALRNQYEQTVLNQEIVNRVLSTFKEWDFFGMNSAKSMFLEELNYPGIALLNSELFFDPASLHRVHNHGIIRMQSTMDGGLFTIDPKDTSKRNYISCLSYKDILKDREDLVSYNIEDLGYLKINNPSKGPFEDFSSFAIALEWGKRENGKYQMIMQVTPQKPYIPEKGIMPQIGGMLAFNPNFINYAEGGKKKGRLVMTESFQLGEKYNDPDPMVKIQKLLKIKYLNKNFNHFPNPIDSWEIIKQHGLPVYISIKNDRLYNEAPQGDVNKLVKTAYVYQDEPIQSLKRASEIEQTLQTFVEMDNTPGFMEFVSSLHNTPGQKKHKP